LKDIKYLKRKSLKNMYLRLIMLLTNKLEVKEIQNKSMKRI